jgi:hypothetical protein
VKTSSRILKHWNDTPAIEQPALFQTQTGEIITQQKGLPQKTELTVKFHIYVTSADKNIPPTTLLNPILDVIDRALQPTGGSTVQTLGIDGISHAWISGQIETYEGLLGTQEVAVIPISILTV